MHIVEILIAERAQKLMRHKRLFSLIRRPLFALLGYKQAVAMADNVATQTGFEAFETVSHLLGHRYDVTGLAHMPTSGPCMIIANHPTGLADGTVLFQALKDRRPDMIFLANADALRVIPKADDIIIPVEWVKNKRSLTKTKATIAGVTQAFNAGRCVVIFPSGIPAQLTHTGLTDGPWENAAVMMARKHDVPIIPLRIKARNSWLYYFFSKTNRELKNITLFHELLNKKGQTFDLTFGDAIDPHTLPMKPKEATQTIRDSVERL